MSFRSGLFTSEAVSAGHPDKLCDRISDTILDEFLKRDLGSRVACETFAADGKVIVAGEFRTAHLEHFNEVRDQAAGIVRQTLRDIGYGTAEYDIDPDGCEIEILFNHQSHQIASGVDRGEVLGAGDQGMMFGYATDETTALMPLSWSLATDLIARGSQLRAAGGTPLKPDAKSQVTVRYLDYEPIGVQTVVLSWQHDPNTTIAGVRDWLTRNVIDEVIPSALRTEDFRVFVNPADAWTIGGPKGDTGLTGRKIIVDSYGGSCPHGGGAFSGKDPSKVDRSGAYAARWVAKNVVAAGLARRCTVQIAYAIGIAEPVSINVDTWLSGRLVNESIERAVREVFDLTPAGIIRDLDLLRPIYAGTSALGHFGKWKDPAIYHWERPDRSALLERAARQAQDLKDRPALLSLLARQEQYNRPFRTRQDLDFEEMFQRFSEPGENFGDDWIEVIEDKIVQEGRVVGRQEWDSGAPGAGAGTVDVYKFRGAFISFDDVGSYGPYDSFEEAADAVGLFLQSDATTSIWVDPEFKT